MTKFTLKNIPNLWGLILITAYFALGSPLPKKAKELLAARAGPKAPAAISGALHMGLGILLALAIFVPLLLAPDPDFPVRSRYATLFESLGRSINAPVMQGLYGAVQRWGPIIGYGMIIAVVASSGLILGWIAINFARLKDRLYDQLGLIKYAVVMGLFLMMMGVLGKIMLRLLFGIKYIVSYPNFNFNI